MKKTFLLCFIVMLFTCSGAFAAQQETDNRFDKLIPGLGNAGDSIEFIDKSAENGRGFFNLSNAFHDYCVNKYQSSSQMYRCKNTCIEIGYPVFTETKSFSQALKASGCFEEKE